MTLESEGFPKFTGLSFSAHPPTPFISEVHGLAGSHPTQGGRRVFSNSPRGPHRKAWPVYPELIEARLLLGGIACG